MFTTVQYDIIIGTGAGEDVHRAITAQSNAPSKLARFPSRGSRRTVLHCAHRTSTVSSCAFCEQEGWSGGSLSHPSETARCTSTGDPLVCPLIPLKGWSGSIPLLRASTEHRPCSPSLSMRLHDSAVPLLMASLIRSSVLYPHRIVSHNLENQ